MESTPSDGPGTAASVFGARAPGELGPAELETLARAVADVTLAMTAAWTELLDHEVQVVVNGAVAGPPPPVTIDPAEPVGLLDDVGGDGPYVSVADLGSDLGSAGLIVPVPLALMIVDLLLGGNGRPAGDRELSPIDIDLLNAVAPPTFSVISGLGDPERTFERPRIHASMEGDALTARLANGALVEFAVTIGEATESFLLLLSSTGAGSLCGTSGAIAAAMTTADESRQIISHILADVVVEAVVTFPSIDIPSHNVLALGVGDVIGLGVRTDQALPLHVDGQHFADVLPARAGDEVACQIVSVATRRSQPSVPTPGGVS